MPTEKAQSLKMQVEAIKHQGSRPGEEDKDAGKRSTQVVGDRNGMNYKQVQRYIRLTELVPDLQKWWTRKSWRSPRRWRSHSSVPKSEVYRRVHRGAAVLALAVAGAEMRELDKEGKLNGDVIDGILSQEKRR